MKQRFGNNPAGRLSRFQPLEVLPERKIVTFRDFDAGLVTAVTRTRVPDNATPNAIDMSVRTDGRIQRAPGTEVVSDFDSGYGGPFSPERLFLHPSLSGNVEVGLVAPPYVGFYSEDMTSWHDLSMADRDEFASTVFGGTLIFTDGVKVFTREVHGDTPALTPTIPIARSYSTFGSRVFAFGTVIDGRFEPLGARWSGSSGSYSDFDGPGSGFELLLNDMATGDRIVKSVPMSFDFLAILMRQSIWVGRYTALDDRPADFSPRAEGVGAASARCVKLTRFGLTFLSDSAVYVFDGNELRSISDKIDPSLFPLDYDNLSSYHAEYNPKNATYTLFTPSDGTWVYEYKYNRWTKRSIFAIDSLIYPRQIDPTRWFELQGTWNDQAGLIWLDYAGENLGDLSLHMLGDQADEYYYDARVLAKESLASPTNFGSYFVPYWETKMFEEQDLRTLTSVAMAQFEYQGQGLIRVSLPNEAGVLTPKFVANLEDKTLPGLLTMEMANHIGKGTSMAVELLPLGSILIPGGVVLPDGTLSPNE